MLWAGLKGAVPILLGTYILASDEGHRDEAYDVVFVVVLFSVAVQGGLVPVGGAPAPAAGEHHRAGAVVAGHPVPRRAAGTAPVHGRRRFDGGRRGRWRRSPLGENVWVSFVGRDGPLVQVRGDTILRAGDQVLVLAEPDDAHRAKALFTGTPPAPPPTPASSATRRRHRHRASARPRPEMADWAPRLDLVPWRLVRPGSRTARRAGRVAYGGGLENRWCG